MKHKEFINQLDEARIAGAIAAAENRSSGEIRVFVSRRKVKDALPAAQMQFDKLGMRKTRQRNGVLLFFAPATRQFAIVGDAGVHEKCGEAFWQTVSNVMTDHLKQGHFTEAILDAVGRVGDLLAQHFPRESDDQNELPNAIARD
jgi:uncharacterized membrane protein